MRPSWSGAPLRRQPRRIVLDILTWLRTARHLPVGQVVAWASRRVRPTARPRLSANLTAERSSRWQHLAAASRAQEGTGDPTSIAVAGAVSEDLYRFANVERRIEEVDWSAEYVSPLWTYHLHYFDHAVAVARAMVATGDPRFADLYVALWTSWLEAAERGNARFDPYPTSIRCMNALSSIWLIEEHVPPALVDRLLAATHAQLVWLARNLETHLRANHLERNLVALTWGSFAFSGRTAETWERYRERLWREVVEQVLPDGCHFERSPMYHASVLDDLVRTVGLCRAADVSVPDGLDERLAGMTRALLSLSRPSGELHLFNDCANGATPARGEVVERARRVLDQPFAEVKGEVRLEASGFYGYVDAGGAGHRLLVDGGSPGPPYQPGHAHCGMLSFELDLCGHPVVVDGGTHGYDGDPYREYVRSTRAHNTVSVAGLEQHEMWATFRVARRGMVLDSGGEPDGLDGYEYRGACRHYHDGRAVHRRSLFLTRRGLSVTDRVEGAEGRPLVGWLHLHPGLSVEAEADGFVARSDTAPGFAVRVSAMGADRVECIVGESDPVQGWYCPEFGLAVAAPVLRMSIDCNDGREFGWQVEVCE